MFKNEAPEGGPEEGPKRRPPKGGPRKGACLYKDILQTKSSIRNHLIFKITTRHLNIFT
jgi:hypothetical protein